MRIKNVHDWSIDGNDVPPETCYVELFARAQLGELTPDEYLSKPFDYFVKLSCTGLETESDKGGILEMFYIKLWFDNCSS